MVLGLSRVRMRSSAPHQFAPVQHDWKSRCGALVYETIADLQGAFPGYLEHGARLDHVQLRVYQSALVIEEGRSRGFFLPFDQIMATDDGDEVSIEDQVVRLRYRDGADSRLFTVRPRPNRLALRGGRRTVRLLDELRNLGVPGGPLDDIPVDAFVTNWGETDAFGNEAMVWHGHASASLMLTGDRFPCDVFITSKSLVWGKDARNPISRVPLHAIRDVTPGQGGSRAQHPAAFIGIGDSVHDRIEFSFVFDTYETEDRNALERSAFVVHLRSRPVPLAYPQPPQQPWVTPEQPEQLRAPIWPSTVTALRAPEGADQWRPERRHDDAPSAPAIAAFRDPAERLRPDRGVMTAHSWTTPGDPASAWPQPVLPIAEVIDGTAVEEPAPTADVVLSEWSVPETMPAIADVPAAPAARRITVLSPKPTARIPEPVRTAPTDPVQAYEVEAVASLTDILDVVRRREAGELHAVTGKRPPSGLTLSAALENIVDRMGRGDLTPQQATRLKARLLGLDDAARRLDVLLPLHANGAVTTAELRSRCNALCAELGSILFTGTP